MTFETILRLENVRSERHIGVELTMRRHESYKLLGPISNQSWSGDLTGINLTIRRNFQNNCQGAFEK